MRIAIPTLSRRRYHLAWQARLAPTPATQTPKNDPDQLRHLFAQDLKASIAKPRRHPKMKKD